MKILFSLSFLILALPGSSIAAAVTTSDQLAVAVKNAGKGAVIELAEGRFEISEPLDLPAGVTMKGAGAGKTVITHSPAWKAATATLPDPEIDFKKFDKSGYLIRLPDNAGGITLSDLTLTGPQLHGAIYGWGNDRIHLHDLRIEDFMYSGIRAYQTSNARIHDCVFVDAGMRWKKGKPGVKGGITGGAIFMIWMKDSEISNNRFLRTKTAPEQHYYGIKGRQGKRIHIHHNTIETNFSIEFPFENDEDVEIDHNILKGTVSIPKHGGGPVPESGSTFHIHHNYFTQSYSIEFPRNGVEIDHNLFDFDIKNDGGNLISGFGGVSAKGPVKFHNNLVNNPGRGVMWIDKPFNGIEFRNNQIIARTTATPRSEGLFGFHKDSDFATHVFRDNVIECIGKERPLFRNDESGKAKVEGNRLGNLSDTGRYGNLKTGSKQGLEEPLEFRCGVNGELMVAGWKAISAAGK